jgi:hypothetical protein
VKSKFGSLPSLSPKKQRHSIDTGVLNHKQNVSPFAATESHDLVARRRLSEQSPTRPNVYKPLNVDAVSEDVKDEEFRVKREKSKIRRWASAFFVLCGVCGLAFPTCPVCFSGRSVRSVNCKQNILCYVYILDIKLAK